MASLHGSMFLYFLLSGVLGVCVGVAISEDRMCSDY